MSRAKRELNLSPAVVHEASYTINCADKQCNGITILGFVQVSRAFLVTVTTSNVTLNKHFL